MRKPHWILQSNLIKEAVFSQIKAALQAADISFEEVKIIPFSDELPAIKKSENLKIFYGTTTLILNAYSKGIYTEGIFYDKEIFSLKNYFDKWKQHMLNFDSEILTFKEILKKDYKQGNWFIRPIYDDKSFSGRVMTVPEIEQLESSLAESNNPYLNTNTLVGISKPKEIIKEWRHFIVNKEIVSSSKYAENGEVSKSSIDVPAELLSFVEERCQEYVPHDIFVMDTALYNDIYKIVECNCFNDTGFYDHNIPEIINAVNRFIARKL
jgi:hypothetical protein